MTLPKSQYIRGIQCHKSLWLYKNKPELRDTPSNQIESAFNTGYDVGELAKELFSNGVEIEFDSNNFNGMIEMTKKLIADGTEVIYEATFSEDGIFAMADILVKSASFLPGQFMLYLSLLPSTIFADNSCFSSSKSIAFFILPFSSFDSVTMFGKSWANFSIFSSVKFGVFISSFVIVGILFYCHQSSYFVLSTQVHQLTSAL